MICITTEEGYLLDMEDSKRYIIWKIENEFTNIAEFRKCMEIKKSSYWGDCILIENEEHYSKWIDQIGVLTLKK